MNDKDKNKTQFDPDYSHKHPHNREAAKDHKLKWDPKRKMYVDEDGCLIRDKFGQPL